MNDGEDKLSIVVIDRAENVGSGQSVLCKYVTYGGRSIKSNLKLCSDALV